MKMCRCVWIFFLKTIFLEAPFVPQNVPGTIQKVPSLVLCAFSSKEMRKNSYFGEILKKKRAFDIAKRESLLGNIEQNTLPFKMY